MVNAPQMERPDAYLDPCRQASADEALRQRPQPRDDVCAAGVQDDQIHITRWQVEACRQERNLLSVILVSNWHCCLGAAQMTRLATAKLCSHQRPAQGMRQHSPNMSFTLQLWFLMPCCWC